jgi:hypothetical protein
VCSSVPTEEAIKAMWKVGEEITEAMEQVKKETIEAMEQVGEEITEAIEQIGEETTEAMELGGEKPTDAMEQQIREEQVFLYLSCCNNRDVIMEGFMMENLWELYTA